jgi:hypothetical protein
MNSPHAVLEEAKRNFLLTYNIHDFQTVRNMFDKYVGYFRTGHRGLQFPHAEITHGTDTFLAFSRILDGYSIENKSLPVGKARTGLITSFFHNISGARTFLAHNSANADFLKREFREVGMGGEEYGLASKMVECTGLDVDISGLSFKNKSEKILCFMTGTANIIGQMASRTYLERLFFLYHRVKQEKVISAGSVLYILKKTTDFYKNRARKMLDRDFQGLYKYCLTHFRKRYGINRNLYMESIENQLKYLDTILKRYPRSYWKKLRRR